MFFRALEFAIDRVKQAWDELVDRLYDIADLLLTAFGDVPRPDEISRVHCFVMALSVTFAMVSCYCFFSAFTVSSEQDYFMEGVTVATADVPLALESAPAARTTSNMVAELTMQGALDAAAAAQSATVTAAVGFAAKAGHGEDAEIRQQHRRKRRKRVDGRLPRNVRAILLFTISASGGFVLNAVNPLRFVLALCM